jgi:hypothetical protein
MFAMGITLPCKTNNAMSNLIHDILLWFGRTPKQVSLVAQSVHWFNHASWLDRLVANRQLENWISHKHHEKENHQ